MSRRVPEPEEPAPRPAGGWATEPRDTGFRIANFWGAQRAARRAGPAATTATLYCSGCGSPRIVAGASDHDRFERQVCSDCGKVHYRNPRIIVRCIADHAGAILLCRRADEPRRGYWTTPGGYLENGEALSHAAAREAHEETGVDVGELRLAFVYEMPQLNEVVMILAGRAVSDASACGPESLEVRFFPPDALPWSGLAFPTDLEALRAYRANEVLPQQAQFFWGGDGRVLMRAG